MRAEARIRPLVIFADNRFIGRPHKRYAESADVEMVAKVATMRARRRSIFCISRPTRLESDPVSEKILLPQARQLLIDEAKSASSAV
jgi:hypothetical protein